MKKFKIGTLVKINKEEVTYSFYKSSSKKSHVNMVSHHLLDLKNDIGMVIGQDNYGNPIVFWINNNCERNHFFREVEAI